MSSSTWCKVSSKIHPRLVFDHLNPTVFFKRVWACSKIDLFFLVLSLAKWTIKERNKWNHITNEDTPQAAAHVSLTPICRAQVSEAKCGRMRVCAILFFSPWRSTSFLFKGLTSWPTAQGRPEHACSSDGGVPRAQTSPGRHVPLMYFSFLLLHLSSGGSVCTACVCSPRLAVSSDDRGWRIIFRKT